MIGRTISHYKILERIGAGGMGEVYEAEDIRLGRTVALKFLPIELSRDAHANRRFMHEARAASSLDHPNICSIYEVDTTPDGRLFICMSYYKGESLKELIARGPMPAGDVVKIAVKLAEGLAAAHRAGVVHRDVKPANVIVTSDGGVRIIDFGLAKLSGASRVTRPGVTLGTIAYKSPEQTRGEEVDGRSDLWSLGMIIFEMLTGELAFAADFDEATVYSILNEKVRRVTDVRDDVPAGLDRIVARCLKKDPSDRYQSARDLTEDLDELAEDLGITRPSREAPRRARRKRRRAAMGVGIAAAAAIGLLIAFVAGRGAIERWLGGGGRDGEDIAVLRFASVGASESLDAFCDGLVETLTSKLTQLETAEGKMWVVPASEIRGRNIESVSDARAAFSVDLVVTGSVQEWKSGFRVIVNVVDADSQRQLKSEIIHDPMTDTSILQDSTVVKLAYMLGVDLSPETQMLIAAGGTRVPAAYESYVEGRGYLQRRERVENIDNAIRKFRRATDLDHRYALAYAGLGEAYWLNYAEVKDPALADSAQANCRRAVDIDHTLAPVHVTLGIINRGTGRYEEAIVELNAALQIDSTSYDATLELANAYRDMGRPEAAEDTYKDAIALRPGNWSAYSHMGVLYYLEGRLDDAAEMMHQVINLYPENVRAYNNLMVFYYQLGEIDNVRATFDRLIEIEPTADTYANMGAIYIYQGRYADAVPILEKATELAGNEAVIWGNLGDAYRYTPGREGESVAAYQRAIQLAQAQLDVNPKQARLIANMAVQYAKVGDADKGARLIEEARRLDPDDGLVLFDTVIVLELAGRREDALLALTRALEVGGYDEQIKNDPELADLRGTEQYRRLTSR